MTKRERLTDLWQAVDQALQTSSDTCARCKTCDREVDAVFVAIYEAGYVLVARTDLQP